MEARIGKKFALYLPKAIVDTVGLKEGDRVLLRASGNTIVIEALRDPIELALSGKKFTAIKPEEAERISLEKQAGTAEGSA